MLLSFASFAVRHRKVQNIFLNYVEQCGLLECRILLRCFVQSRKVKLIHVDSFLSIDTFGWLFVFKSEGNFVWNVLHDVERGLRVVVDRLTALGQHLSLQKRVSRISDVHPFDWKRASYWVDLNALVSLSNALSSTHEVVVELFHNFSVLKLA